MNENSHSIEFARLEGHLSGMAGNELPLSDSEGETPPSG